MHAILPLILILYAYVLAYLCVGHGLRCLGPDLLLLRAAQAMQQRDNFCPCTFDANSDGFLLLLLLLLSPWKVSKNEAENMRMNLAH